MEISMIVCRKKGNDILSLPQEKNMRNINFSPNCLGENP